MIDKDLNIYDDVCTGCSACTEACFFPDENGILPIVLIKKENKLAVPRIDMDTCVNCKACYRACPTEDKIYNNSELNFENYKEQIGDGFFGYSLDSDHRFEAATAGVITEIASYMLKTNQVDGVLSSYQDSKTNEIVTKIYTDIYELRKTTGSIYRQVNLLNGFDEKVRLGNHKKLLVIGLPCHIAGLNKLKRANKYFRKNIEFVTVSIFCKQTKTEEFSDYARSLLNEKNQKPIFYRGKGWPGNTRVEGRQGLPFTHLKLGLNWPTFTFAPSYCFTCSDPLGVYADISVGDAWLNKYYDDKIGSSLFIANTDLGKNIIKQMQDDKVIFVKPEEKDEIIKSQSTRHIRFKTTNILQRDYSFGNGRKFENRVSLKYKMLIYWIKIAKSTLGFLQRNRITNHTPMIFMKVLSRIYGIGFRILSKDK